MQQQAQRRQYQAPRLRELMLRETPATWSLALSCVQRPPDALSDAAIGLVKLADRYNGMVAGIMVPQEDGSSGDDYDGLLCGGLRAKRATLECRAKLARRVLLLEGRAACLEVVRATVATLTGSRVEEEAATCVD
jgi:hypothetical protein